MKRLIPLALALAVNASQVHAYQRDDVGDPDRAGELTYLVDEAWHEADREIAAAGELVATRDTNRSGSIGLYRENRGRLVFEANVPAPAGFLSLDGDRIVVAGFGLHVVERGMGSWQTRAIAPTNVFWQDAVVRGNRIVAVRTEGSQSAAPIVHVCTFTGSGATWSGPNCTAVVDLGRDNARLSFDGSSAVVVVSTTFGDSWKLASFGVPAQGAPVERARLAGADGYASPWISFAVDGPTLAVGTKSGLTFYREQAGSWQATGMFSHGTSPAPGIVAMRDGLAVYASGRTVSSYRRSGEAWQRTAIASGIGNEASEHNKAMAVALGGNGRAYVAIRRTQSNYLASIQTPVDANSGIVALRIRDDAIQAGVQGPYFPLRPGHGRISLRGDAMVVQRALAPIVDYYLRVAGHWQRQQPLPAYLLGYDRTPIALALVTPTELAVTARDPTGKALYLIDFFNAASWFPPERLANANPASDGGFGDTLQATPNAVIVGSPQASIPGAPAAGAVYVYRRASPYAWQLAQTLVAGRANPITRYGASLAARDDLLVVGPYGDRDYGVEPTVLEVYREQGGQYVRETQIAPPTGRQFDYRTLAVGDDRVAVGIDGGQLAIYARAGQGWIAEGYLPLVGNASAQLADGKLFVSTDRQLGNRAENGVDVFARGVSGWQLQEHLPGLVHVNGPSQVVAERGRVVLSTPAALLEGPALGRITTYSEEAVPAMPASVSGIWYSPYRSGEGWFLERLDGGRALLVWFTYPGDFEGAGTFEQSWILATGREEGNRFIFDDALTASGPAFGAAYDAERVMHRTFGRIEFVAEACGRASISYRSWTGEAARRPLEQLGALAATSCDGTRPAGVGDVDGSWFDPARSGEGILVHQIDATRIVAAWFTYDAQGRANWLFGQGTRAGDTIELAAVRPVGTSFGDRMSPGAIRFEPWGTVNLRLADCEHLHVDYVSSQPGWGSASLSLQRLTRPFGTSCTPP